LISRTGALVVIVDVRPKGRKGGRAVRLRERTMEEDEGVERKKKVHR
jgi:hypothetical protein